jgi:hypothetical protein
MARPDPEIVRVVQDAMDGWRLRWDPAQDHGPTMAEAIVWSLNELGLLVVAEKQGARIDGADDA